MTSDDWHERTGTAVDAGRDPRWLWLSPGGTCLTSFQMKWMTGEYEELHDVWLAGINSEGEVQLAMASGFPRFIYEANIESGGMDFPDLIRPVWRDPSDIGLNKRGFVDQALLDLANERVDGGDWIFNRRSGQIEEFRGGRRERRTEGTLFADGDSGLGGDRSGWSPEELANPGTRWNRDVLHDRRHQAFLDGLTDLGAYDWGIPTDRR